MQSATEEMVARIFRSFPGMEYCDLKRDRITGQSKVARFPMPRQLVPNYSQIVLAIDARTHLSSLLDCNLTKGYSPKNKKVIQYVPVSFMSMRVCVHIDA